MTALKQWRRTRVPFVAVRNPDEAVGYEGTVKFI
jgi:hypothetical protein